MNSLVLLLALVGQATEPASPFDTSVRIHVGGWLCNPDGSLRHEEFAGSGTVIRSTGQEATILTCAHIFELISTDQCHSENFDAPIRVDLFDGKPRGKPQEMGVDRSYLAELVDYDFTTDIGLIRITPGRKIPAARLNLNGLRLTKGQRVRVAGSAGGRRAAVFDGEILVPRAEKFLEFNPKFLGIECIVAPAPGFSGGGLFNRRDELIGVTGYSSADADCGLYVHPESIKKFLIKNKVISQ